MTTEEHKLIQKEIHIIQERLRYGLETPDDQGHLEALQTFCNSDPFIAKHEFSKEDCDNLSVAAKIFTNFVHESKMNTEYLSWICSPSEDVSHFMQMADDCENCHAAAITVFRTDTRHHPWDPPVFSYKVKCADEFSTVLTPDGIWYRDDDDVWCFLSIGTAKHMVATLSRDDKFQTFEKMKEKAERQKEQEKAEKGKARAERGRGRGKGKEQPKQEQKEQSEDALVLEL